MDKLHVVEVRSKCTWSMLLSDCLFLNTMDECPECLVARGSKMPTAHGSDRREVGCLWTVLRGEGLIGREAGPDCAGWSSQ